MSVHTHSISVSGCMEIVVAEKEGHRRRWKAASLGGLSFLLPVLRMTAMVMFPMTAVGGHPAGVVLGSLYSRDNRESARRARGWMADHTVLDEQHSAEHKRCYGDLLVFPDWIVRPGELLCA